jgi:hypothetical protein
MLSIKCRDLMCSAICKFRVQGSGEKVKVGFGDLMCSSVVPPNLVIELFQVHAPRSQSLKLDKHGRSDPTLRADDSILRRFMGKENVAAATCSSPFTSRIDVAASVVHMPHRR